MEALAQMITITLPDGTTRKVASGTSLREIAEGIGRAGEDALAGRSRKTGRLAKAQERRAVEMSRRDSEASRSIATRRPTDGNPQAPFSHRPDRHGPRSITATIDFNPNAVQPRNRRDVERAPDRRWERDERTSSKDEAMDIEGQRTAQGRDLMAPDGTCHLQAEDFIDLCRGPSPLAGTLGSSS